MPHPSLFVPVQPIPKIDKKKSKKEQYRLSDSEKKRVTWIQMTEGRGNCFIKTSSDGPKKTPERLYERGPRNGSLVVGSGKLIPIFPRFSPETLRYILFGRQKCRGSRMVPGVFWSKGVDILGWTYAAFMDVFSVIIGHSFCTALGGDAPR
ncbi:unnamed protein product [Trypanosoma congolense IL3000]|uniref:WGS project CAEQ00000000 data, annotated contig 1719 n=1 Tax=Trypanosoma congolense (strain IL3000) TaxID=1068625 RepID=F9W8A1_TRYCI|nr:unnamed protein product [Trypanosoma congolense IL3000]